MTAIAEKPELKPELKQDPNPVSKDDLKTLPMPELQKKLGVVSGRPEPGRG